MPAAGLEPPTLRFERACWRDGAAIVAGVDEVGRGAWAGPLVAAAVILPRDGRERARLTRALNQAGLRIRDSKQLLPDERARISSIALELEIAHGIGLVAASEIDQMGLGKANREVFARAVSGLGNSPDVLLTDAFIVPTLTCQQQALIRGDALSLTIALASIIAKHHRDSLMAQLAETHPGYGFARHKGYGTRAHAEALAEHGACPEHRRSFRPVAEICRSA